MVRTLLIVTGVLIVASLSPLLVLWPAQQLGLDPATMQGANFEVDAVHLGLFFSFVVLTCAIPLAAFRWIHRRRVADLGFGGPIARDLVGGHVLGFALAGTAQAIGLWGAPGSTISWAVPASVGRTELVGTYLFFVVGLLTLNSLKEELLYRAYPLEALGPERGRWLILLTSAALFSATHLILEPPSVHGFVFRFLFGVLAGRVYLASGSLWAAIGVHNGWNWVFGSSSGNWKLGGLWALSLGEEAPWVEAVAPVVLLIGIVALELASRSRLATTSP